MTTERHNRQPGQGRDEAEAHSQVERLFLAAVQLPPDERISLARPSAASRRLPKIATLAPAPATPLTIA